MPTTPTYALPYPAAADPPNVPSDMAALANRLELVFPSKELAYAELTGNVTITAATAATAQTIVSAAAVTYTANPILIEFYLSLGVAGTGGATIFNLWDGSTDLGIIAQIAAPAGAGVSLPVAGATRLTPTAASHTYIVKAWSATASGQAQGGAAGRLPAFIRITRV